LRQVLRERGHAAPPVHIHLDKDLPIAAGIGGGSADAAATLRGLQRVWNATLPDADLSPLALRLGADVPMCLVSRPLLARGIGESLTPVALPAFSMVLVNPLVGVSTPEIFRRLERRDNAPLPPLPAWADAPVWMDYLKEQRNDLEPPARSLVAIIGDLITALEESGARLARMSGSGATCFGLYADKATATAATQRLATRFPEAYIQATHTLPGDA
jgi:4-diphosphocytidyl-2-C-methyl-D-erythritol kinase